MAGKPVAAVLAGIGIGSQGYYARAAPKIAELDAALSLSVEHDTSLRNGLYAAVQGTTRQSKHSKK